MLFWRWTYWQALSPDRPVETRGKLCARGYRRVVKTMLLNTYKEGRKAL